MPTETKTTWTPERVRELFADDLAKLPAYQAVGSSMVERVEAIAYLLDCNAKLLEQRDELLEALEGVMASLPLPTSSKCAAACHEAEAAIDRCKD